MDIDERDIEKGALPEILPCFYSNSISYLNELSDYRMYAEVWSNKKSKENMRRMEMGHAGYLKTLEFGERKKKRKSDKVRFDYFVVADSIIYKLYKNVYGEQNVFIQMGRAQTNTIINDIIKAEATLETQPLRRESEFHSEGYLPETFEINLKELGLSQDEKSGKYYFEISTNSDDIANSYQKMILLRVLGKYDVIEKLQILNKVGRKSIRCLFEDPGYVTKRIGKSNAVPRLCVAWPFHETLIFDFAGMPEDYEDTCLLGTYTKAKEGEAGSEGMFDGSQLDSYA